MIRRLCYFVFCIGLLGCGKNINQKDLDEPCTRTDQCVAGLVCSAGVCLPAADAGPDGGS